MSEEEILRKLREAVSVKLDAVAAKEAAEEALRKKVDPMKAIYVLSQEIRGLGDSFECNNIFLPQLVLGGDAMSAAVTVLETAISKEQKKSLEVGRIVFGTAKGDIHDIGKSIVIAMLRASGFEVFDLGVDVSGSKFIEEAKKTNADAICASSLLTVTMQEIADLVQELKNAGLRDRFKVMVGGGATSKEWAKQIGADGYAKDATEAVRVAKELLSSR